MLPSAVSHSKLLMFVLLIACIDEGTGIIVDWSCLFKETTLDMTPIIKL